MSKRPVLTVFLLTALTATSASAQFLGGVRGTVGQTIGGVRGTIGQTVGTAGRTAGSVGGTVGGSIGGLGGQAGGTIGSIGGRVGGALGGAGGIVDGTLGGVGGQVGGVGNSIGTITAFDGSYATRFARPPAVPPIELDHFVPPPEFLHFTAGEMAEWRKLRLEALIRANRGTLERDDIGQPVRKGELIVADPDPASLSAAQRAGFRTKSITVSASLGMRVFTLAVPRGMNARQALKALRQAAPALHADYNHVYEPAGGALLPAAGAKLAASTASTRRKARAASATRTWRPVRIAMIDGGIASHPSLARANIEQKGFVGAPQPTGHGTAIGSLLVGNQGPFRGAAQGAELYVGDVYGGNPASGSAISIVQALAWSASKRPTVINISLVGPPNQTLARAVSAVRARGIAVVAAVGNDGPSAPPQYPASYPGVIAVTGVDGQDRALREAGRAAHLDFAAPGADLVAALPGNGYTPVRGTSFAAPFVAARLAATGSPVVLAAEAVPGKGKVGRGIVCRHCRILPKMVSLR